MWDEDRLSIRTVPSGGATAPGPAVSDCAESAPGPPCLCKTRPVRGREWILIPLLAILLALGLAACGEKDETTTAGSTDTGTTTTGTGEETNGAEPPAVKPAEIPDDWERVVNEEAGFSFGMPPGWTERSTPGGQGSIVTSPDELVAVTITADRTEGALGLPLDEFATRTAEALGSDVVGRDRFKDLFVTRAVPFKGDYEAAAVRASGKSVRTGTEELIFVVVLRSPDAAFVVVSRENAEQPSDEATRDDVKAIIRSLRSEPAD